ncbi:MAG: hypothetical protein ABSH20_18310 [Tepidisphaeraceae bacterium]|jgi:hypothetical protein
MNKLDYKSPVVEEPISAEEQFRRLLLPLLFLVLGLLVYGVAFGIFKGRRPAAFAMGALAFTAAVQTALGLAVGCYRGHLEFATRRQMWCAALKLAAAIVFCNGLNGCIPAGGYLGALLLGRLLMLMFEIDAWEAMTFGVFCALTHAIALYALVRLLG